MSGHTPGPWEVRSYDKGSQRDMHGIFKLGNQLPIVESVWGRNIHESDANAKLIAAAPQLLEALQNLLGFGTGGSMESEQAKDDARRAIVAATGDS